MPSYANERFLNKILSPILVASFSRDKVNQPIAVPVVESMKRTWPSLEVRCDQLLVSEVIECASGQILTQNGGLRVHHVLYLKVKKRRTTPILDK
jgi:hypothetical protein